MTCYSEALMTDLSSPSREIVFRNSDGFVNYRVANLRDTINWTSECNSYEFHVMVGRLKAAYGRNVLRFQREPASRYEVIIFVDLGKPIFGQPPPLKPRAARRSHFFTSLVVCRRYVGSAGLEDWRPQLPSLTHPWAQR